MKSATYKIDGYATLDQSPIVRRFGEPFKAENGILFFHKSRRALSLPANRLNNKSTVPGEMKWLSELADNDYNKRLFAGFGNHINAALCGLMEKTFLNSGVVLKDCSQSTLIDHTKGREFCFDKDGKLTAIIAPCARNMGNHDGYIVVMVGTCLDIHNNPVPTEIRYSLCYKRGNVYWMNRHLPHHVAQNPSFGLLENTDNVLFKEEKPTPADGIGFDIAAY